MFVLCFVVIGLLWLGPGHGQGINQWLPLMPRFQLICFLLVSRKLDDFWLIYSIFELQGQSPRSKSRRKFHVMAKVNSIDRVYEQAIIQYTCFSFRGYRGIFGWDIANSIFDLENSRSRSRRKPTETDRKVIYISGQSTLPKTKENRSFWCYRVNKVLRPRRHQNLPLRYFPCFRLLLSRGFLLYNTPVFVRCHIWPWKRDFSMITYDNDMICKNRYIKTTRLIYQA